ncbi:hypothetical protein P153DRAFT_303587, partial [Dothidotthia symphoricarpi CBS 119687]
GTQRQRVYLVVQAPARAVYAREYMAVFSDVLNGLDSKTMNHFFHAVFRKDGPLSQSQTTVLLATHSGRYAGTI